MGMMKEFKEFAVKGNVVDMAVGVIIGGAFGTIVKSLVADVIMPPIGVLTGNIDFSQLKHVLVAAQPAVEGVSEAVPAVTINYGTFINNVISFLIVAFSIFIVIKQMNRFKAEEEAAPAEPTDKDCPFCASSIAIKATRCPCCTSELASA